MLTGPIPDLIDHRKLANQQREFNGSVPVSSLPRLGEALADDSGDVHLEIAFSRSELGQTRITGTVSASVSLVCQKCLNPYTQSLKSSLQVVVVPGEDALAALDDDEDGFICGEDHLSLVELLEDELLLSVPMIPRHPAACPGAEVQNKADPGEASREDDIGGDTYRPFAGLADAFKKADKDQT
ncbi:MAG: YceD family protein [Proteobacteria bacterium]|nr:YceD family protein [Pseudomonadota bacterium]